MYTDYVCVCNERFFVCLKCFDSQDQVGDCCIKDKSALAAQQKTSACDIARQFKQQITKGVIT